MRVEVDLSAWVVEQISNRATALDVSFDVALERSLGMSNDQHENVLGWAVAQGESIQAVAARSHYSESTVRAARERYRQRRLPNVGGST